MQRQMTDYISLERRIASIMCSISHLTKTELVNKKLKIKFSVTSNFPDLVASRKATVGNTWKQNPK